MGKSPVEKPKRLNEEEAQKEANMLRVDMRMSPETGKVQKIKSVEPLKYTEQKPTREDYERARKRLDELEKLAENDPEFIVKLNQYITGAAFTVSQVPMTLMLSLFSEAYNQAEKLGMAKGKEGEKPKEFGDEIKDRIDLLKWQKDTIFSDARSKLERLEEKGEKFGKAQSESEEESKEKAAR